MMQPKILYKYKALDTLEQMKHCLEIAEGKVYMPTVQELNDPMELYFGKKCYDFDIQGYSSLETLKDNTRVLSFSGTDNEFLMWIHYASSFRGVCFGYSTDEIRLRVNNLNREGRQVELVKINYATGIKSVDKPTFSPTEVYTTKLAQWVYEDEYRVVQIENESYYSNTKMKLTPAFVKFGTNVDKVIKQTIVEKIQMINPDVVIQNFHPNICLSNQNTIINRIKNVFEKFDLDDDL